jgi:hypothetical protein
MKTGLHDFVRGDLEKWTETTMWIEALLAQWKAAGPMLQAMLDPAKPSPAPDLPTESPIDLKKSLGILMRGSPGRRPDPEKQNLYAEMHRLHIENKYSYARLAKKFFPEEFKTNPEGVKARIRRGIERLKDPRP